MKKLITFLMLILSVSLIFSSCTGETGENTTETPLSEEVTEAPAVGNITFIADGATEYKLVRAEKASKTVIEAFTNLRGAIKDTYGATIQLVDDFEKPGADPATRYAYEIVVGNTNREESSAALEGLGYSDSVIAVIGNRLVINGGSDDAVVRAVELFIEKYITGSSLELPGNLRETEVVEYAKTGVTIDGTPLSEYVIVYGSSYSDYAKIFAERVGKITGIRFELVSDKNEVAEHEIVIGSTSRTGIAADFGVDDFEIKVSGKSLHLIAPNKTALGMGCAELIESLIDEKTSYTLSELALKYTLPVSRDYINDIESFPLHWAMEFDTPDWMLDFDEKYAASMDPTARLMSCAHRGDMVYYPENSIEGIISAIMMGCDMVEIDPRLTKDGVFILLHDATLTRTTNVEEFIGKNGFPNSYDVSAWTYDQLMQLNLKNGTGGDGAKLTPYKIPTLDEAMKVCANRIFIRLDVKGPSNSDLPFWDFEKDIWPLMQKYESYSNIIYTWHSWFKANSWSLTKTYRAKAEALCGKPGIVFIGDQNTLASNKKTINAYDFNPGIRLSVNFGDIDYKKYLEENKDKLASYKDKLRTYADVHNGNNESHAFYAELYDAGINYFLVNKALSLCTYIAENFSATEYQN
ncbi:MAG: glycerophosphodiester phosphodiesterase family protein [Clostridia bacterium]|nr:glycerophosphodiester phosphodiesterase family protein [Clostridia bacterium]